MYRVYVKKKNGSGDTYKANIYRVDISVSIRKDLVDYSDRELGAYLRGGIMPVKIAHHDSRYGYQPLSGDGFTINVEFSVYRDESPPLDFIYDGDGDGDDAYRVVVIVGGMAYFISGSIVDDEYASDDTYQRYIIRGTGYHIPVEYLEQARREFQIDEWV